MIYFCHQIPPAFFSDVRVMTERRAAQGTTGGAGGEPTWSRRPERAVHRTRYCKKKKCMSLEMEVVLLNRHIYTHTEVYIV